MTPTAEETQEAQELYRAEPELEPLSDAIAFAALCVFLMCLVVLGVIL